MKRRRPAERRYLIAGATFIVIITVLCIRECSLLFSFQGLVYDYTTEVTTTAQQELSPQQDKDGGQVTIPMKDGQVFDPGSLSMSKLETFQKCYVDPCRYRHHIRKDNTCSVSHKYNLTYYMIGKAASSTCREIMNETFSADEKVCDVEVEQEYNNDMFRFTFVRDPYSRFLSAFRQAFMLSFKPSRQSRIPAKYYHAFKEPFENMTMADYLQLFYKAKGRQKLQTALQNFILAYDAELPFDGHVRLQVPRLAVFDTGRTRRLEGVYDTKAIDQDFANLATMVDAPLPQRSLRAHERDQEYSIDATDLTRRLRRKICKLSAIDYCCLNYELPEACKGAVQCRWTSRPEYPGELLIESLSKYPPIHPEATKKTCQEQKRNFNQALRSKGTTGRMEEGDY